MESTVIYGINIFSNRSLVSLNEDSVKQMALSGKCV
jgi:hypothetical protein